MDITHENIESPLAKKLLYAAVVPRPIAWVSTISANGVPNLAPYSFFNAVCSKPPTVTFCPGYRDTPYPKDTLANVRETGEFVVNFVTNDTAEAMNLTAVEAAQAVDEFERAGVTTAASSVVKVPRVAESPVNFECKLNQIVTINEAPGGGYIVIGTIVHMHVHDDIYDAEQGYLDMAGYGVIGRFAGQGTSYIRTDHTFDMTRPPSELFG